MSSPNAKRVLRFSMISLAVILAGLFFYHTFKYTYPFIIGYFFAMFMNPLVNYLIKRFKMPRILAVAISMLIFTAVLTGIIIIIVLQIIAGAKYLLVALPKYFQEFSQNLIMFVDETLLPQFEKMSSFYQSLSSSQQSSTSDTIHSLIGELTNWVMSFLRAFVENIPSLIAWLPNVTIGVIFILLATFFISQQWDKLFLFMKEIIPEHVFNPLHHTVNITKKALVGFLRAQFILFLMSSITASIGFYIIGIEYPITMGLVVGVGEIIPYIGVVAVFFPWIIFAFITGDITLAVGLMILFAVIAIQRVMIEPKVLSKSMDLNPLATLFVMFVGLKIMGVIGVLLGTVVLVILTTLYRNGIFGKIKDYIMR